MSLKTPNINHGEDEGGIVIVANGAISPTGRTSAETHQSALEQKSGLVKLKPEHIANFELMAKMWGATDENGDLDQVKAQEFFDGTWGDKCGAGAPIPDEFIPDVEDEVWPNTARGKGKELGGRVLMGESMKLAHLAFDEARKQVPELFGEDGRLKPELRSGTMVDIGNGAGSAAEKMEEKVLQLLLTEDTSKLGDVYGEKGRYLLHMLGNMIAGNLANITGAGAGHNSSNSACASAGISMVNGFNSIRSGAADIAIWGGAEDSISSPATYVSFDHVMARKGGALDRKWKETREASNALMGYGAERAGFIPGSYGGVQIMMKKSKAEALGLTPIAEVLAAAQNTCDPLEYGKAQTDGTIRGQAALTEKLFNMAGIAVAGIRGKLVHYLHGTGTQAGAMNEIYAAAKYLGALAEEGQYMATSNKERHGHSLGAAFIDNANEAIEAIRDKKIAGMPTTKEIDPKLLFPDEKFLGKEGLTAEDIRQTSLEAIGNSMLLGRNGDLNPAEDLIMFDAKGFGGTNAGGLIKPIV